MFQNYQINRYGNFDSSVEIVATKKSSFSFKFLLKNWVSLCIPMISVFGDTESQTNLTRTLREDPGSKEALG